MRVNYVIQVFVILLCHFFRMRGGVEAEREERRIIREEEEARKRANFEAMQQIRREGFCKVSCWSRGSATITNPCFYFVLSQHFDITHSSQFLPSGPLLVTES